MSDNCQGCRWFRKHNEYGGWCYVAPPVLLVNALSEPEWVRPWVKDSDGCALRVAS